MSGLQNLEAFLKTETQKQSIIFDVFIDWKIFDKHNNEQNECLSSLFYFGQKVRVEIKISIHTH